MNSAYSTEGLFDSVLESSSDQSDETNWTSMIGDIVSSSNVEKVDPRVDDLTEIVDKVTQRLMQSILHQKSFRELEANWRSIDRVVRSIETSGQLQVYVLNLSSEQLRQDLESPSAAESSLNRILVEQTVKTPGGEPWSIVGCMGGFGANEDDINSLARLCQLASAGQFSVVAGADGNREAWDSDSAIQNWKSLRAAGGTNRLCVVWPKYLFRLPYGSKHGRVDSFAFEELYSGSPEPWSSATPLVAICLAQRFQEQKWDFDSAGTLKLSGLPMFFRADEDENQAPGQYLLTETQGNRMRVEFGITPLYSVRDTDEILFSGIGSVGGKALY
jgi:predicted component of type VI protein secretion system